MFPFLHYFPLIVLSSHAKFASLALATEMSEPFMKTLNKIGPML